MLETFCSQGRCAMSAYEYEVAGRDLWFEVVEAENIHEAVRQVRRILSDKSLWEDSEPFVADVTIRATDGSATIKMPVECSTADGAR